MSVAVEIDVGKTQEKLGCYTGSLDWDPEVLRFVNFTGGTASGFGNPTVNVDEVSNGHLAFANADVEGVAEKVNILNVNFESTDHEGSFSFIDLEFSALTAAHTFNDLLAGLMIEDEKVAVRELPTSFALEQNYPNPFNPITTIHFTLPDARRNTQDTRHTTLKIFNLLGQEVTVLLDEEKEPGYYTVTWDGRNEDGNNVPSGVYFYRLEAGAFVQTKRMLLLR